jgi:copper chaperone NosL
MRRRLAVALLGLLLAACHQDNTGAAIPPPQALTAEAIGHYCGMNVLEHPGPKGQIILASRVDPVWFSSARDAIVFTLLPEEPRDIQAVYVSDMAKAASWDDPGAENWVDANKAWFVIGSRKRGGMGADEAVPFSDRDRALRFVDENGGRVVGLKDIPRDYVLGGEGNQAETISAGGAK